MKTKLLIVLVSFFEICGICARDFNVADSYVSVCGYVKSRGRIVNGKLVPGKGLSGVAIEIKGENTVVTSGNDGRFCIRVRANEGKIIINMKSVRKSGYELLDKGLLNKPIGVNYGNTLYIVMDTPEQQLQDKLASERKIRRTLQKQLQDREEEIERLKAENKLTEEEYRKALQNLYKNQENNERLISDMFDFYSRLDYDQLDEFYREVSWLIEQGELIKADSMLNTRDNIDELISAHMTIKDAIKNAEKRLDKTRTAWGQEKRDLQKRCHDRYEYHIVRDEKDSAAYYLELCASLDTADYKLMTETGLLCLDELYDDEKALGYFYKALKLAEEENGNKHISIAETYQRIGRVYHFRCNYNHAIEYYEKALTLQVELLGDSVNDIGRSKMLIGLVYNSMNRYNSALECFQRAKEIFYWNYGNEPNKDVAAVYNDIGCIYLNMGVYDNAANFIQAALEIYLKLYDYNHPDVAECYNNIANVYNEMKYYNKAIEYYKKSAVIYHATRSSYEAMIYNNIGTAYFEADNLELALDFFERAYERMALSLPESHPWLKTVRENIDVVKMEIEYSK